MTEKLMAEKEVILVICPLEFFSLYLPQINVSQQLQINDGLCLYIGDGIPCYFQSL